MWLAYYIVKNNKILNLFNEYSHAVRARTSEASQIMKDCGAIDYMYSRRFGLLGLKFEGNPDEKIWKVTKYQDHYYPKRNTKAGKELAARFKKVGEVSTEELDIACGYTDMIIVGNRCYWGPAIETSKCGTILMVVPEQVIDSGKFKLPDDVTEITYSEYKKLKGE